MKLLVFVPCSKAHPESMASIRALKHDGLDVSVVLDYSGNGGDEHRFARITRKAEAWRQIALAQGYDALVSIEDDQVVPHDALCRMADVARRGADVVYGLSVWRERPERWTAALELSEPNHHVMLSDNHARAVEAWGSTIPVAGVHMGCTLMTRRALEAVTFVRRGVHCYDYYAACDWQRLGIQQVCDTGLLVGHITEWGTAWPDVQNPHMYRIDNAPATLT